MITDPFYSDLANLFSLEAFDVDSRGGHVEADRLWEIADEFHERAHRDCPRLSSIDNLRKNNE